MPRQLESLASAARRLSVHPKTVRRYVKAGLLAGYRVGPRDLRVDVADVDALARPLPTDEEGSDVASRHPAA